MQNEGWREHASKRIVQQKEEGEREQAIGVATIISLNRARS